MKNSIIITLSLILFILVLFGVTVIETIAEAYPWIENMAPIIVLSGFFTFLVSVGLFLYGIFNIIKKK